MFHEFGSYVLFLISSFFFFVFWSLCEGKERERQSSFKKNPVWEGVYTRDEHSAQNEPPSLLLSWMESVCKKIASQHVHQFIPRVEDRPHSFPKRRHS